MPRYILEKKKVPNLIMQKSWYCIPVKSPKGDPTIHEERYLIPPRVADYIELLEKRVDGLLPKLPRK